MVVYCDNIEAISVIIFVQKNDENSKLKYSK